MHGSLEEEKEFIVGGTYNVRQNPCRKMSAAFLIPREATEGKYTYLGRLIRLIMLVNIFREMFKSLRK